MIGLPVEARPGSETSPEFTDRIVADLRVRWDNAAVLTLRLAGLVFL